MIDLLLLEHPKPPLKLKPAITHEHDKPTTAPVAEHDDVSSQLSEGEATPDTVVQQHTRDRQKLVVIRKDDVHLIQSLLQSISLKKQNCVQQTDSGNKNGGDNADISKANYDKYIQTESGVIFVHKRGFRMETNVLWWY